MAITTTKDMIAQNLPHTKKVVRGIKKPATIHTEDLVQEATIKAIDVYREARLEGQDASIFENDKLFRTWIRRVASNVMVDELRTPRVRRTDLPGEMPDVTEDGLGQDGAAGVVLGRVMARLRAFFAGGGLGRGLPEARRERMKQVFDLSLGGLSNEKIAKTLGIGKATVHKDLEFVRHKVLADLRRERT